MLYKLKLDMTNTVKDLEKEAAKIYLKEDLNKFEEKIRWLRDVWKQQIDQITILEDKHECKAVFDQAKSDLNRLCSELKERTFEPATWIEVDTGYTDVKQYVLQMDTGCVLAFGQELRDPIFIPGIRLQEVKDKYYLNQRSRIYIGS